MNVASIVRSGSAGPLYHGGYRLEDYVPGVILVGNFATTSLPDFMSYGNISKIQIVYGGPGAGPANRPDSVDFIIYSNTIVEPHHENYMLKNMDLSDSVSDSLITDCPNCFFENEDRANNSLQIQISNNSSNGDSIVALQFWIHIMGLGVVT